MSVSVSNIDSPMELSSNFILSCEANNITGLSVGADVLTWNDYSGANNHVIRWAGSTNGTYKIDAQGFPCVNFLGTINQGQYRSTNNYVQPSEVTYVVVYNCATLFKQIIQRNDAVSNNRENLLIFTGGTVLRTDVNGLSSPTGLITNNMVLLGTKVIIAYRRTAAGVCQHFQGFISKNTIQLSNLTFSTNSVPFILFQSITSGEVIDGDVYAIHICHEALSDQKLKQLIRYAAFKSGIKI